MRRVLLPTIGLSATALILWLGRDTPRPEPGLEHGISSAPPAVPRIDDTLVARAARPTDPAPVDEAGEDREPIAVEPPPDPVAAGEASLYLELFDSETGDPIASPLRLWRLDVPENASWTRGDQLVREEAVSKDGLAIVNLVPGRYRAELREQSFFVDDPAEFVVTAPLTRHQLTLRMPEKLPARLVLYDARGSRVHAAEMRSGHSSRWSPQSKDPPAWVTKREPRVAVWSSGGASGAFGAMRSSHSRWRKVKAGPRGFELGPFPLDTKEKRRTDNVRLRVPESALVLCAVMGSRAEDRDYVGVVVDEAEILGHLILPDGSTAADGKLAVTVEARAIALADAKTSRPWREVPIHVKASVGGYEELAFSFRLDDGPLEDRYFVPSSVSDEVRERIIGRAHERRAPGR